MDIDPPPRRPGGPTDAELAKLGLPTHHVHYHSTADGRLVEDSDSQSRIRPASPKTGGVNPSTVASEPVEPPRALPLRGSSSDDDEYRDRIEEIDYLCNLNCGAEGQCFMVKDKRNTIMKRCLCPHGKYGEKCGFGEFFFFFFFWGGSEGRVCVWSQPRLIRPHLKE